MPVKFCSLCGAEYFARWRNTPAVCESCALHVVICPGCWKVTTASDPAQLSLFDVDALLTALGAWRPLSSLLAGHFANTVPRDFDWETYTEHLLSTRRARNLELLNRPPWPRRASTAERQRYPFQ